MVSLEIRAAFRGPNAMPSDPFASAPLLDGPDAELGLAPELHPSAPPDALSPQELQQLLQACLGIHVAVK